MSEGPASASAAATPPTRSKREAWSGQTAFILAAVGSAVGLGNIWRFPGEAYDNGGGAFMIPYLVALITAGIPILFLENAIGHRFRGSAPLAFRRIVKHGEGVGWWHVAICFVIGLYYTVIIAWALSYFFFSFDLAYADDPAAFFNADYLQIPDDVGVGLDFVPGVLIPLAAVWAVAIAVLALGIAQGVEKLNVIGIPLLVATFGILVVRALRLEGASEGVAALFTPDFSALTDFNVWIAAYGQVFFSLSLAYGVMLTYASYRRRRSNLTGPALVVAFGNSSFSLLAGLGVFATLGFLAAQEGVAVADLEGIAGVQLSFVTFPAVIAQMPGGEWFGALFFASLVIAGLTSLISVLQSVSAALQDKFAWSPRRGALTVGLTSALLSMLLFGTTTALYVLDVVDQWSNQMGIVVGAVAMIVATLWFGRRGRELARHQSVMSSMKVGRTWLVIVNAVALLLVYVLIDTTVSLVREGYDGYPEWFTLIFGWGAVAFLLVIATVMPLLKWRHSEAADAGAGSLDSGDFVPWPSPTQLGLPADDGAQKDGVSP